MRTFLALLVAWLLAASPAAAQLTLVGAGRGGAVGGGGGGATFVDQTYIELAGGFQTFAFNHAGAVNGDLMVAYGVNSTPGQTLQLDGSGNFLTVLDSQVSGPSYSHYLFSRTLTTADLTTGTISTSGWAAGGFFVKIVIYHGAGSAAYRGFAAAPSTSTLAFSGFSPAGGSLGIGLLFADQNNNASTISCSNGTWNFRANAEAGAIGWFHVFAVDQLSGYTNATTNCTTFGTGGSDYAYGYIWELLP